MYYIYYVFEIIKDKFDDFLDNGTRIKCENCKWRTILQYPITTCGDCGSVFRNYIQPKPLTIEPKYGGVGSGALPTSLMILSSISLMVLSKIIEKNRH